MRTDLKDAVSLADLTDNNYSDRLATRVREAIERGASTLTGLCQECEGAFPTAILEAAEQFGISQQLRSLPHRAWTKEELGTEDASLPSMPEPHPIDCEWRYTKDTAENLCDWITRNSSRSGCFGTPSVFVRLATRGHDVFLVDRNPGLRKHFPESIRSRMITVDLALASSSKAIEHHLPPFDTILLDPPWYWEDTLAWIDAAMAVLRPGGTLLLTVFPAMIRPTAAIEREKLVEHLKSLGPLEVLPFPARYTTPLFESETLSWYGLADLGQWRSGDLVKINVERPQLSSISVNSQPTWHRVQLGRQVIALSSAESSWEGQVTVTPADDAGSFLLKSVSARDPIRRNITFWTSRNRAARVTGMEIVTAYFRLIEEGLSPVVAADRFPVDTRSSLQLLQAIAGW
jgi:hypothetical protein